MTTSDLKKLIKKTLNETVSFNEVAKTISSILKSNSDYSDIRVDLFSPDDPRSMPSRSRVEAKYKGKNKIDFLIDKPGSYPFIIAFVDNEDGRELNNMKEIKDFIKKPLDYAEVRNPNFPPKGLYGANVYKVMFDKGILYLQLKNGNNKFDAVVTTKNKKIIIDLMEPSNITQVISEPVKDTDGRYKVTLINTHGSFEVKII